jgi:nucleotidyltransferase substrate binding protein (TIGR01987 family)
MNKRKLDNGLDNLGRALGKLKDALDMPRANELILEGTIQRFEYVIELFWKTLKRALEYEGIVTKTPRESLKQAYAVEWLHDEMIWLAMLDSRNRTSHLYLHEDLVENAYEDIRGYYPEIARAHQFLKDRFSDSGD